MNFYSFDDIKSAGSCASFAQSVLGLDVIDNRCAAVWRGGTNAKSVAFSEDGKSWFDHGQKNSGGGILELCAVSKFGGDLQQAQEFLGQWLRLAPKNKTRVVEPTETRYSKLLAEGYTEAARYHYNDENGALRHIVVKLTHPKLQKQFLQRTPERWGVKGVELVLYNLDAWKDSRWVVVVEGEKDAETLKAWGIPATTNCGGAEKWHDHYNARFEGKDVVVCLDNDEAGRDHGRIVLKNLARHAKTLRLICPSIHHKGDVTDWRDAENGNAEKFMALVTAAPEIPPDLAEGTADEWAKHAAKKANEKPLSNTERVRKEVEGHEKWVEVPRKVNELVKDVHTRFLSFPRKLGDSTLFDHDRHSDRIEHIRSADALFAWIGSKSETHYHWERVSGAVTKGELYAAMIQQAIRYESVSSVPDWPRRADVYYSHGKLPDADDEHRYFNALVSFFAPATPESLTLVKTLLVAPLFFQRGIPRPVWVIDSTDGQGVGKSTFVEIVADLYCGSPMRTSKKELDNDVQELKKRMLSAEGRNSKILLVDNVKGTFKSPEFADMTTAWTISGKAPYGLGEETRPNNLTYVLTANSATFDQDISVRTWTIFLKRPVNNEKWKERVLAYIEENRYQIFSDALDILNKHKPFEGLKPVSRVPEFETRILQAMCANEAEYEAVCHHLAESRSEGNVEEEQALQATETLRYRLQELPNGAPDTSMVFIRAEVVERWLAPIGDGMKVPDVRNLAKVGLMPNIDKTIKRFPAQKDLRRTGIMWVGERFSPTFASEVVIVGTDSAGKAAPVKVLPFASDYQPVSATAKKIAAFENNFTQEEF
jgi:5S rRNA maturation endonuclease (ribonuclease M5)